MNPFVQAATAGVMYGLQPFIIKLAGLSPAKTAFVVEFFTLVVVAVAVWYGGDFSGILQRSALWAVLAGCIGGVAWLLFASLVKQVADVELPDYVTVMVVFQVAVYAGMRIFHGGFSLRAAIGYAAALVAAFALSNS